MATKCKVMSLKLLIDSKGKRILFAEADKTAIDFLFHILTLPMATVIRLLTNRQMVGCIGNLYDSIKTLDETYVQTNQTKDVLLEPKISGGRRTYSTPLLAHSHENNETIDKVVYRCGYCSNGYFSEMPGVVCPGCMNYMQKKMNCVPSSQVRKGQTSGGNVEVDNGGFVKGVVTYMVMDDLVVKPMSTISSIALLNKMNVKEVGSLEEKVVDLGMDEALELLKTSLMSKTVLTTVFLK